MSLLLLALLQLFLQQSRLVGSVGIRRLPFVRPVFKRKGCRWVVVVALLTRRGLGRRMSLIIITTGGGGRGGVIVLVVATKRAVVVMVVVNNVRCDVEGNVLFVAHEEGIEVEVEEVLLLAVEDGEIDVAKHFNRIHDGHFDDLLVIRLEEVEEGGGKGGGRRKRRTRIWVRSKDPNSLHQVSRPDRIIQNHKSDYWDNFYGCLSRLT